MSDIGYDIEQINYGTAYFYLKDEITRICRDGREEIIICKIDKFLFFKIKNIETTELIPFSNVIKVTFFHNQREKIKSEVTQNE